MFAKSPPVKAEPVVVFDLDGCLVSSKEISTNNTHQWGDIWANPAHPCNTEMVKLARAVLAYGWHVAILTARPIQFRRVTEKWVERHLAQFMRAIDQISITMYGTGEDDILVGQQAFKAHTVGRWVGEGVPVLFAIEDYKPNADQIRQHVPVLLYESVRPPKE